MKTLAILSVVVLTALSGCVASTDSAVKPIAPSSLKPQGVKDHSV
jgi:hypothetical protein